MILAEERRLFVPWQVQPAAPVAAPTDISELAWL
jgi:hypothetical protein